MTINTGSSTGGAPSIPFSQENTFALNQVLMFDTTLNAFVNTALPVGGTTGEINTGSNLGAGQGVFKDKLGADMRFKSVVAGSGISVTADADEIFIAATGTGTGDITGGTSTGTGNAVFRDKSGANLRFRSLTAGTNVTLTQNADDIVVNAGTNALTLNSIADTGYVKVANNLSDVTAATARTNLAISSTAEADAKYIHLNTDKAPTTDGAITLGTGVKRFKEIYAVSFKGNADTATVATSLAGFTPANYVAVAGGDTMTGTLTLSGTPTNALHAATKGYVDTTVANLIDSSPGALNTLNELAAAIGDDANFSTTITNSIATKLPLAGGTLTGALTLAGNPASALIAAPKQYVDAGDALQLTRTNNLSDLANAATARTNLGLGTAATTASTAYLAAGTLTTNVAEGTNKYYTDARADARIAAADTDDLSEGSTNLYHTVARAKAATVLDAIVNGVTDVAPSQNAVFDALALKEGTITAAANTTYYRGDKTFQTLNTTAVAEGTNLYYTNARADARIAAASISALSNVHTAAPTDGQILKWDNGNSRWAPASHSTLIGTDEIKDTHIDWGVGSGQVSTADVPEQTNLYYTDARADARADVRIAAADTDDLSEGSTNLYHTNARADARADVRIAASNINALANVHTAAPTDGQVLKWDNGNSRWAPAADTDTVYTSFNSDFDTRLAAKTTANLAENTNLYYTNARADARITAAVGSSVQAYDADLTAIGALAKTDGNFIVANGTTWVAENAATARTSLGLGTMAVALTTTYYTKTETDTRFANVVGTGNNLADLADAAVSRTNLGLGTAAVANTTAFADPTLSNLSNYATARTNLGTIGLSEGDARYVRLDVTYAPTVDNTIVLGDTTKRFNTIYARQFIGQMGGTFTPSTTTDSLTEGSTNLYYTNARADARAQLKIDALVASAPGALDTLNELAASINDDANFAGTMTTALAGKEPTLAAGTTAQYYKGNKTWATLDTAAVAENTNLYFTNARADARVAAAALSALSDVHNAAPTDGQVLKWVNANSRWEPGSDAGHATTSTLTEGTNLYYTDARVDTRVGTKSVDVLSDVDTTSAAPTANQVLTWNAGSSKWVPATPPGASGSGEANDGANVGTAGVGIYDGKVGATLNFRKLNSLDANLTIVDDTANDKIDFNLNADVMLISQNLVGVTVATAKTNLGLGTTDSPTFGGVGTGFVNVTATPSNSGATAPTSAALSLVNMPVASTQGYKWVANHEGDGDLTFSYYTINDAGANVGSSTTFLRLDPNATGSPAGGPYVSIGSPTIPVYLSHLSYPTADGTANQVLTTDGAGTLSFTTVSGGGGVTTLTALTDVDAVVAGDDAKVLYYNHATTSFKWKVDDDTPAGYNNTNWDTAYGWGNHASGGYLTSIAVNSINDTHIDWGTGSNQVSTADIPENTNLYYTDARADARIVAAGSANWNTAFGWGNHASGGYLTSIAANSINDTHIDWGTGANQVSTADIPEQTNLYYTDVRADARVTAGSINNVVEDTTPQLGGDLDGNSKAVTGVKRLEIVDSAHTGSSLDLSNGAVSGGVQKTYVLSGSTTNNTQTEIFVGAQASTRMAISANNVWMFDVDIIAINSGNNEQAGWKYSGMIHNVAGTTSLTSNLGEIEVDPQTNWSVAVEADNTNDALVIKVTGENSKTIKWAAFVKTTQLS